MSTQGRCCERSDSRAGSPELTAPLRLTSDKLHVLKHGNFEASELSCPIINFSSNAKNRDRIAAAFGLLTKNERHARLLARRERRFVKMSAFRNHPAFSVQSGGRENTFDRFGRVSASPQA